MRWHGLHKIAAVIRRAVERICLMNSDKVVTLSHYMRNKMLSVHGVQPNKAVVIPGGVDLERFRPLKDRLRIKEEIGFPPGALHLLTVRNLEPRMGLDNLLESLRIITPGRLPIHLTIVGEGPERDKLRRMIAENRLEDRVAMTGSVSTSELVKYYGAADFFVIPTRDLEGFGLVTPESMACGTPVMGTPVGATREILSKFEPEFLFADNGPQAIAAGIEKVAGQFSVCDSAYFELRRRCREFARDHYSWDRHIRKLISVMISDRHISSASPILQGK